MDLTKLFRIVQFVKKQTMHKYKSYLVYIIFMFLHVNNMYGDPYDFNARVDEVKIIPEENVISITMFFYDDDGECAVDQGSFTNIDELTVQLYDDQVNNYFNLSKVFGYHVVGNNFSNYTEIINLGHHANCSKFYRLTNTSLEVPNVTLANTVNVNHHYLNVKVPIPEAYRYKDDYKIKLFVDPDNGDISSKVYSFIPGWPELQAPTFSTELDDCLIRMVWNEPESWEFFEVNQKEVGDGAWAGWQALGNVSQFIDGSFANSIDDPNNEKLYQLRIGYGTSLKNSLESDIVTGTLPEIIDPPSELEASLNQCDTGISVSWSWSGPNPKGFNLSVLGKEFFVLGNQRSYNLKMKENLLLDANILTAIKITSVNECNEEGSSEETNGKWLNEPEKPTNFAIQEVTQSGNRIFKLTWTDVAINEDQYILKKVKLGSSAEFIKLDKGTSSFDDENVSICEEYAYEIFAQNNCTGYDDGDGIAADYQLEQTLSFDLGNTFGNQQYFEASKGYYPNRIEVEWSPQMNTNLVEGYNLYRRILGSSADFDFVQSFSSNDRKYIDELSSAGVFYEYLVFGEADCNGSLVYSDTVKTIGFRSPVAVVNGQISYEGGISVSDVKVLFETSSSSGKSIELQANSFIQIDQDFNNIDNDQSFFMETWIKPTNSNFDIFQLNGQFTFSYENTNFKFSKGSDNLNLAGGLILGAWQHVGLKYDGDSLFVYVDGIKQSSINYSNNSGNTFNLSTNTTTKIGEQLVGNLDEIRFWNIAPSDSIILLNYSRHINSDEIGLITYLKVDEIGNAQVFDISHQGEIYHKNDGDLMGNISISSDKPLDTQLSNIAYTNQNGTYSMFIPYSGVGQNFTITPSYGVHQFLPASTTLFMGDGANVNNGVDFEDISSFQVTGDVFFKDCDCPVREASLYIDGEAVIANGYPVQTSASGTFDVRVPIGYHILEVKKNDHVFSEGRFPAQGTHNFYESISGINFIDSTFKKIVGRVVGGDRERSKSPGFGKNKNNIGTTQLKFISQLNNGCYEDSIYTDAVTGEYTINLPPLKFVPKFVTNSNPDILQYFDELNLITIKESEKRKTIYDSTFHAENLSLINVDSFSYDKIIDYIYYVKPEISVTGIDGVNPFIGDTVFEYTNSDGTITEYNLNQNPFNKPVFSIGHSENFFYKALIKVFEKYENMDSGLAKYDSVPSLNGKINIINEFTNLGLHGVELSDFNTKDSLKSLVYSFKATGVPNFLVNMNADLSYTKKIEIYTDMESGQDASWLPHNGGPFRGYLLAGLSIGNQFVTEGPDDVDFILRDPPGSGSSATRASGSTSTTTDSWDYAGKSSGETEEKLSVGAKFSTGLGMSIETEIKADVEVGLESEISIGREGSVSTTITNTQAWSTDAGIDQTGAGSDLFIGKSRNVEFGIVKLMALVPASECDGLCLGDTVNGLSLTQKYQLSVVPGGYSTNFIYSQNHIKNYLIPDIIDLRNALLLSDSLNYESLLSYGDSNFGKSNDDPSLHTVSTNTPDANEMEDWSGISYIYTPKNLADSLKDDLWNYNQQIRKWEEALRLNEWEKVNIDNTVVRDSLKQLELDNLYAEYEEYIIAYDLLSAVEKASALRTHISSMTSFGTIPGIVSFASTVASGVASAEIANKKNEYDQRREVIIDNFETNEVNFSISGGASYSSSMSHERAVSTSTNINYNMSTSLKTEISALVNGTGASFGFNSSLGFSKSQSNSTEEIETEETEFTIFDGDQGDFFSVDVYQSILGFGPIFKLREGGQTSCPYEGEIVTEYYEPGTVISGKTFQRDNPNVEVFPETVTNIPYGESASFTITLGNKSESEDTRIYNYELVTNSNPHGAIVKIDGLEPEGSFSVGGQGSITKILTVEKGPGSTYEFDDLLFIVTSPCQYDAGSSDNFDIGDSVYFSAHFIPSCTDIDLYEPENNWVLNNSYNNERRLTIGDYDINFYDLINFDVQYKPSNDANWTVLHSYHKKDTLTYSADTDSLISKSRKYTYYNWDISDLPDGNYDLRVVTECGLASDQSPVYSGIIDRVNPHAFGSPNPVDGILDADEDISITFNEDVEIGSITHKNFDIRGVLNGSEISHQASVGFNGSSSYVEIPHGVNLQTRDFTIEFWAKNNNPHNSVFLSQGPGVLEGLRIGSNENGHLYFEIAGERVKSNGNIPFPSNWHHYSYSYDYENERVEIYVDDTLRNGGNTTIHSDYIGSGKILLGKSTFGDDEFFDGNIHDLRIWNHKRSSGQIAAFRNIQVGKQNIGLLHNYKMDEVEGNTIIDNVRLRNGVVKNGEWTLFPSGYALDLAAEDSSNLTISSGNIALTNEKDFTIEFWYKGSSGVKETLFSNGTGVDSLGSWSLSKFTDGSLHLLHNGLDFEVVGTGSFDGTWHHFALVVDRVSALKSYLDGNLAKTFPSDNLGEFGAANFALGARINRGSIFTSYDEHFTGQLDEFRFWGLTRSQKQIERDMRFTQRGDEIGLLAYFPFEKYSLSLGVYTLEINLSDAVDTAHAYALHSDGDVYNQFTFDSLRVTSVTPKIKLSRPIEKVNFTYSINGNKIILTPTSPEAQLENVTLDVTVRNIEDLHGNKMQSPETWIAYIDRNQVFWETELVTIELLKDEGYSFTKKIVNSGGSSKNFTIENVPNWLTTSVSEGLIEPGSTFEVTFTVVEDVNIGSYKEDIIVMTDFNYPERLTVDLKVRGEEPDWSVNPADFEKSMSIIGAIGINDVVSIDDEDILYVFIDDECRGKANLQYVSSTDKFVLFLDVYSNSSAADSLEFKIWDASTGSIFVDVIPGDLTFVTDGLIGSLLSPQQFDGYSKVQESYALQAGWNWVSFHLGTADTANLTSLLSSIDVQDGDQIKTLGNNTFATYSETFGWLGDLTTTGVNLAKGYKLKLGHVDTLVNIGDVVDPTDYSIKLNSGWSWIGFVSIRPMNINVALGNLEPTSGDLLKGQTQFSVYDEQLGWIGSLNTLHPNQSYMYNSLNNSDVYFTFPVAGGFKMMSSPNYEVLDDVRWPVAYGKSISNMSAIVQLEQCENSFDISNWYIGFFDGTGTCRSLSPLEMVNEEKQLAYVTAVGDDNLTLVPKLLNRLTGQEIELDGKLDYQSNTHQGSYSTPISISLRQSDCDFFIKPVDEELNTPFLTNVYPSLFKNHINVDYYSELDKSIEIELVNALGQIVYYSEVEVESGDNTIRLDKNLNKLPSGVYLLNIQSTQEAEVFKLIKNN